jgi:hypothetical protein
MKAWYLACVLPIAVQTSPNHAGTQDIDLGHAQSVAGKKAGRDSKMHQILQVNDTVVYVSILRSGLRLEERIWPVDKAKLRKRRSTCRTLVNVNLCNRDSCSHH